MVIILCHLMNHVKPSNLQIHLSYINNPHIQQQTTQPMGIGSKIRKLDVFKKIPEDLSEPTNIGGFLSLLTVLLISFFVYTQLYAYMYPHLKATILLDELVTRNQMRINLDIEFPRFPCEVISLDMQDIMLSHHANIASIQKYRLDANGQRIDAGDFELLREPDQMKQYQTAKEAFRKNYGCRLAGSFTVKQVPGNFHISSHAYQNIFARLMIDQQIRTLDVSHIIHQLYFGDIQNIKTIEKQHPQAVLTKLNGYKKFYDMKDTPHSYTSHYHLDIVPTVYRDHYFTQTNAYQYTYNHNTFEVHHMPVVWFNFHIGGLSVNVLPEKDGIAVFLIRLCAVVGGLYTLANFVANWFISMFKKNGYQLVK